MELRRFPTQALRDQDAERSDFSLPVESRAPSDPELTLA